MWRTGLRVSEALALEWRDLDLASDEPTLIVRRRKGGTACTVPLDPELVQPFNNWPVAHGPRDSVVDLTMRTALRHMADGIKAAGPDLESQGTGQRLPEAHSLRHSAIRHWLMVGKVPLNVVSTWRGNANVRVTLRTYLLIVGGTYSMDAIP